MRRAPSGTAPLRSRRRWRSRRRRDRPGPCRCASDRRRRRAEHRERLSRTGVRRPRCLASRREQSRQVVHDLWRRRDALRRTGGDPGRARIRYSRSASSYCPRSRRTNARLLVTVAVFGWSFAQPPQIEVEHLAIEPLRFGQLPFLVEQDGQVVHRRRGLEMVGTEHLQPHVERAPRDGNRHRCCGRGREEWTAGPRGRWRSRRARRR